MLLNFAQHSKKSKQKACDNRVAIAWVSLILEVKTPKSKKEWANKFLMVVFSFFSFPGMIGEALEPLRSSGNRKR